MKIEKLPIESNSAEIVYISHVLEHISDSAAHNILSECYRILKPNGLLRIVQPDIDCYYNAYKRGDQVFLVNIQKIFHLNCGKKNGLVFRWMFWNKRVLKICSFYIVLEVFSYNFV